MGLPNGQDVKIVAQPRPEGKFEPTSFNLQCFFLLWNFYIHNIQALADLRVGSHDLSFNS